MTGKVVYSSDGWFEFHATDEFLFFYYYFELIADKAWYDKLWTSERSDSYIGGYEILFGSGSDQPKPELDHLPSPLPQNSGPIFLAVEQFPLGLEMELEGKEIVWCVGIGVILSWIRLEKWRGRSAKMRRYRRIAWWVLSPVRRSWKWPSPNPHLPKRRDPQPQ